MIRKYQCTVSLLYNAMYKHDNGIYSINDNMLVVYTIEFVIPKINIMLLYFHV